MCGSCDNDDMGEVNELFGALYRLHYSLKYQDTFSTILKQLRYDACSLPNLRKYSTKLDKYTHEWMQQMVGYDIMECRRPHDGPPPYNLATMTLEQLVESVAMQEMEDQKKRDEEALRVPLFSSYSGVRKKRRMRLPRFQL